MAGGAGGKRGGLASLILKFIVFVCPGGVWMVKPNSAGLQSLHSRHSSAAGRANPDIASINNGHNSPMYWAHSTDQRFYIKVEIRLEIK